MNKLFAVIVVMLAVALFLASYATTMAVCNATF